MSYYVYVLLCEDGSYYTGYAKDIDSRLKQHMIGVGARYTKLHKPKRIVYAEEFDTIREAMKREREIKRLSHDEKEKLLKRVHRKRGDFAGDISTKRGNTDYNELFHMSSSFSLPKE